MVILRLLGKRFIQLAVVFFVVSMVAFLMLFIIGNPVYVMFGGSSGITQTQINELTKELGLDRPVYVQYLHFIARALTKGDFGVSYYYHQSAMSLILERIPATLQLAIPAILLAILFSVLLGVAAALHGGTWIDRAVLSFSILGTSVPVFWLASILIYFFAVHLKVLPSSGYGGIRHVVLPLVGVVFSATAVLVRLIRSETLETLSKDFVRTARAKGLPTRVVIMKHVLRNSLIPFVTYLGLMCGNVLGMTVVTERIFAWPGSGQLLLTSIERLDQPVVISYVVIIALIFVIVNFIVDMAYLVLDPRIRARELE
jgi:peptide/nickel transport system permease protein